MPKKVLPDIEAFRKFCSTMELLKFRKLATSEWRSDRTRLGLEAPSPRRGREIGFCYIANGLEARVWTTVLAGEGCAREQDAGWVLVKEGDTVKYFSHPLHRTKNFLDTLLWFARIARWRVRNRPLCPMCKARMDIVRGKGIKSRYWKCSRQTHKPVSLSWDYGLPEEAQKFLRAYRKRRKQGRQKRKVAGKKIDTAVLRRKGWKVGRPENAEPAR